MTAPVRVRTVPAMNLSIRAIAISTAVAAAAAGCGDGARSLPAGVDGKVVFQDALDDNRNGWLDHPLAPFRNGEWEWNDIPGAGPKIGPDALHGKEPDAVSVSASVTMREGHAFRAVGCRFKDGPDGFAQGYELGIDGRRGLVRKFKQGSPVRVLARHDAAVADGREVQITGRCIPDGRALVLSLLVEGKVVVQVRDDEPFPRGDLSALTATPQPGSAGIADLSWDDFVVREARLR
jgi:hypothetical protein